MTFDQWCTDVRTRHATEFSSSPAKAPNLINLDDRVQERMMRCGVEARAFGLNDQDDIAILAHHTLLVDDMKWARCSNSYRRYSE